MKEDFWTELYSLKQRDGFEYTNHSFYSHETKSRYSNLFQNVKDPQFQMYRAFFLSSVHADEYIRLGSLRVEWDAEVSFSSTIQDICLAFQSMYKMNYQLWKITDTKDKQALKKQEFEELVKPQL